MTFNDWATLVLSQIAAPRTLTNFATLNGWSAQEKTGLHPAPAVFDWFQWCNPMNTTEPWPGAVDSGAQAGPHDVKIYLSLLDGAAASVATLTNGFYPAICDNLRNSVPASSWTGAARTELDTWGTGQGWLSSVPLQGDDMFTDSDHYKLQGLARGEQWSDAGVVLGKLPWLADLEAKIVAISGVGGAIDQTAVLAAIADLKAHPAVVADPSVLVILTRIETALKAA